MATERPLKMTKKDLSEPNFICLSCEMSLKILCGKCNTKLIYDTAIKTGGRSIEGALCPKHRNWIKIPVWEKCDKEMTPY